LTSGNLDSEFNKKHPLEDDEEEEVINLKQKKKEQDIHASLRNSLMKKVNIPEN